MNYEDRVTKEYVEGLLGAMPKIAAGSYVGTGEGGATITFPFVPKLLFLYCGISCGGVVVEDGSFNVISASTSGGTPTGVRIRYTLTDNVFQMFPGQGMEHFGMNAKDYLYTWVIIG